MAVREVVAAFGAIAFRVWYWPYTAIDLRADALELHYLWPRPPERLDPKAIISTDVTRSVETTIGLGIDVYALELRTATRRYLSMDTGSEHDVQSTKARVDQMRALPQTK